MVLEESNHLLKNACYQSYRETYEEFFQDNPPWLGRLEI